MNEGIATADGWSVDELEARSGVSVRTIRYYQSEGLLPAPERVGRSVRYRAEHLDRLGLINQLQARGLRLSAIAELIGQQDASVEDWIGLGEHLERPWSEDRPQLLSEAELMARTADLAPESLAELVRYGVVEHRPDTTPPVYFVPSPGLLEVALELVRLGIDLRTGAQLRDVLAGRISTMATELVAQFTAEVSAEHLAGVGPSALASLLEQLQPLTRRTVDLLFAHEMERAQRELLQALAEPGPDTDPQEGSR